MDVIPLPAGITWPQVGMTLVLLMPSLLASVMAYLKSLENGSTLDKQDKALEGIQHSVNGGLSAAKKEIGELKEEIVALKAAKR